jgi:hypothetical protein
MNDYLETGIAVVLIFFVFSIVTYVIQELIAANLKYRGKMLKSSIEQILNGTSLDEKLAVTFFAHPQVRLLQEELAKLPSYIPAANFAMAVMDIVASKNNAAPGGLLNDFKAGIAKFQDANGDLPTLFKTWVDNSKDVKELKVNIEKWFNEYMDRVTGWYKKKHRWVTRIIAIGIALAFNLDMIKITETIHSNATLKAMLVAQAEKITDHPEVVKEYYSKTIEDRLGTIDKKYNNLLLTDTLLNKDSLDKRKEAEKDSLIMGYSKTRYSEAITLVDSVSAGKLIFGWEHSPFKIVDSKTHELREIGFSEFLLLILGLLIGAAGISMGAPFWFDLMIKLVNVRRAGLKPKDDHDNK